MRYFSFLVAMFLCLSVVAFCAPPPHAVIEDGNTVLRTFILDGEPPDVVQFFNDVMSSSRSSFCVSRDGSTYYFAIVPETASLVISENSNPATINIRTSTIEPSSYMKMLEFHRQGDNFVLSGGITEDIIGFSNISLIVGGRYWTSYTNFPHLSYNYIADITGDFIIETDNSSGGDDGGILGWLADFWQKLVDTLKGLFVPSVDYFSDFFNEIKTAFDNKLGGIGNLLGSLSGSLDDLDTVGGNSSLVIKLPDNFLFSGYSGLTVDVLKPLLPLISFVRGIFNSFLVVMTIIICYRKVIAIVHT